MRRVLWFLVVIVMGAVVVLSVLQRSAKREATPSVSTSKTAVEVFEGKVEVEEDGTVTALREGEKIGHVFTDTPPPTATQIPLPVVPVSSPNTLSIRVVDALGDLIQNASVEIAGTVHAATDGRLAIDGLDEGEQAITAHAEGYASTQLNVQLPARETVDITLEYLCTFVVEVRDKHTHGQPVAGVEVSLWEGPAVVRPVPSTVEIAVQDQSDRQNICDVLLRREEEGMRVLRADGFGIVWARHLDDGMANPQVGDQLLGLSGSQWRAGDRTQIQQHLTEVLGRPYLPRSRLRLWDTFVALSQTDAKSVFQGVFEFESQGARFRCNLQGVEPATRGRLIATRLTDEQGQCRFEGLPPRVYFANARKDKFRTSFKTLRPSHRWEKLWLRPESEASVAVTVRKEGISRSLLPGIAGADVHLKAVESVFVLSGKTNGRGSVRFNPVPWGQYKLTVTPPRHIDASPSTKIFELMVEEPYTSVVAAFEVEFGVTVSGRVLRADTKEPVERFPLELQADHAFGSASPETQTYSAADGSFSFSHVPPGKHTVKSYANTRNDPGLLPLSALPMAAGKTPEFPDPRLTVEDQDIEEIEYLVVPGVETRFVGQVARADGQPAENVDILLDGLQGVMLDAGRRSGGDGRFDYSIRLPVYDEPIRTDILGLDIEKSESTTKAANGKRTDVMPPEHLFGARIFFGRLLSRGSCPVEFKVGDTICDIRLVLQPEKELGDQTVNVRIAYEGGEATARDSHPSVSVYQDRNFLRRPGLQEDGLYRIDGLQPGAFQLTVSPESPSIGHNLASESQHEKLNIFSYQEQRLELEMPEGEEEMEVDVLLKRGSHLHGRILDTDRQPISGIPVTAIGRSSYCLCITDAKGFFLLDGLPPDIEHTLTVLKNMEAEIDPKVKPLKKMEGIKPPVDNIVIMIDRPE